MRFSRRHRCPGHLCCSLTDTPHYDPYEPVIQRESDQPSLLTIRLNDTVDFLRQLNDVHLAGRYFGPEQLVDERRGTG
jgi:hypothetical protein